MKKTLIYHRDFGKVLGGGEYLPLFFAAELQKSCDVTLALDVAGNVEAAAERLGIALDPSRLRTVQLMPAGYSPARHRRIDSVRRFRALKRLAPGFDVRISTANMMDFGLPAHHFLSMVYFGDAEFADRARGISRSVAEKLRRKASGAVSSGILRPLLGMRTKRQIVLDPEERVYPNSEYLASLLREHYGPFEGGVFHPPTVFEPAPGRPRRHEPPVVAYIGRIVSYKRVHEIIGIVEKARAISGADLHFAAAGPFAEPGYEAKIRRMADERSDWVELTGPVYGGEKAEFLSRADFAVHAERDETFGIAVTEYLKAGLVPVVPDEGGAREVVDDPDLAFADPDSAAAILARLATDGIFRETKRASCAKRAAAFARDAYLARQSALLGRILA